MLIVPPAALDAQVVSSKGSATMPFGAALCSTPKGIGKDKLPIPACRQPSALEIQSVQHKAALNAVERMAAEGGEAALKAYDSIKDSIEARFSDIVLTVLELTRSVDSAARQVSLSVRVDINEARLRNLMQGSSAIATGGGNKSQMGTFMLAREAASVESFGTTTRRNAEASLSQASVNTRDSARVVKEKEVLKDGAVTLDDKVKARDSSTSTAKASASTVESSNSIRRADIVQYRVAAAQDLDAVLAGRLSAAGFEVVEAAFFEDDATPTLVETVRGDFATGDDLKASTVRRMLAAAQKVEVKYVLVGTVDVGAPSLDDVSGNQRVYAKVSAKVYDLSGRLPRTVVNVAPSQYAGLGPDASVAKVNALKSAGEATAREVLAQLSAKQVR